MERGYAVRLSLVCFYTYIFLGKSKKTEIRNGNRTFFSLLYIQK